MYSDVLDVCSPYGRRHQRRWYVRLQEEVNSPETSRWTPDAVRDQLILAGCLMGVSDVCSDLWCLVTGFLAYRDLEYMPLEMQDMFFFGLQVFLSESGEVSRDSCIVILDYEIR